MGNIEDERLFNNLISSIAAYGYPIYDANELVRYSMNNKDEFLISKLISSLNQFKEISYKDTIVRSLTKKNLTVVTKILINEFHKPNEIRYLWVVGNALYTIEDTRFITEYLQIIRNRELRNSRQMLVLFFGKKKFHSEEAKKILIQLLSDYEVSNHALDSLSKYKGPALFDLVQEHISEKTRIEFFENLKSLKKYYPDDFYIQAIDIKGSWSLRVKTAKKFKSSY
ncbi:MAG: hypothetical protein WCD89_14020 [Anaerocolumna sp.]